MSTCISNIPLDQPVFLSSGGILASWAGTSPSAKTYVNLKSKSTT
jgi:hypothetical protein